MSHEQQGITQMFDSIAALYDKTNRILSLGQDLRWRLKMAQFLPKGEALSLLDVATGTADVIICLCKNCAAIKQAIGIDVAQDMLKIGQKKLLQYDLSGRASLRHGEASELPFADGSFDVVSIAFGVRNIVHHDQALAEFYRVLKREGRLIILEFSLPPRPMIKMFYLWYFRHLLPLLGGFLAKNHEAYRYLNRSVEGFYGPEEYRSLLLSKGFAMVELLSLSFGIATIYSAEKG